MRRWIGPYLISPSIVMWYCVDETGILFKIAGPVAGYR